MTYRNARPESRSRRRRNYGSATMIAAVVGLALCAGAGAARGGSARPAQPSAQPPNIVFILTDDLAPNLIAYMPHVLAMERTGITFPNYILSESLCCPSRSSMLTGRYPDDTQIWANTPPNGGFAKFHNLGEEQQTFATALAAAGYRTALMGKYLNGYVPTTAVDGQTPYIPPGWSEWDVAGEGYSQYNYDLTQNTTVQHFGDSPGDYMNTVLDQRAQSFVSDSAAGNQPFLLEVATFSPHKPYTPAPADVGSFAGLSAPSPPARVTRT